MVDIFFLLMQLIIFRWSHVLLMDLLRRCLRLAWQLLPERDAPMFLRQVHIWSSIRLIVNSSIIWSSDLSMERILDIDYHTQPDGIETYSTPQSEKG
ncbi:hypothetical protein F4604DRAFT_1762625 [Suillus subluteus]|nr:hypothetical protein F4604DRAFT_1762625 [Suillus subluteus]